MTDNLNVPVIDEWVDELRNGNRLQTGGHLDVITKNGERRQCCLGVVCDLIRGRAGLSIDVATTENDVIVKYNSESATLPQTAWKYLGFTDGNPEFNAPLTESQIVQASQDGKNFAWTLSGLNDDGFTFAQIADVIAYMAANPETVD
jgi:hypothetical protein